MLNILSVTGPIYIVIFLGWATTRTGLFTKADMRVLGKFVINLALPALLFSALAQHRLGPTLNGGYLLAYALGSLTVLGVGLLWARRFAGMSATTGTIYAMGMTCSNSGFVGYPILLLTLPSVAGISLALNMIVENALMIPLLLVLAERGRSEPGPWHRVAAQALTRLAGNPLIIALVAGLAVSASGLELVEPLARTVKLLAMSSGAISLFVIGGTLACVPLRGMGKRVTPIALGKLVLHPLAVFAAIQLLPLFGLLALDGPLRTAAVLMAAMPTMGIYPILAQAYRHEDLSATALLMTTAAAFFTLSGVLFLLKDLPLAAG